MEAAGVNDPRQPDTSQPLQTGNASTPLPVTRGLIAGFLMGLANLVPGISGGTMILVMGLYDEFVTSVADVTRLKLTRRNIAFLAVIVTASCTTIVTLAGTLSRAVTLHQSVMYSLFIGLTLGGVPALLRMLNNSSRLHNEPTAALTPNPAPPARNRATSPTAITAGLALGLGVMILIAVTREAPPNRAAIREAVAAGTFVVEPAYARDFCSGILGMSAMILPGISGAYMLLITNRYESILAAIALFKQYAFSWGNEGDPVIFLRVILPAWLGAMTSLILFSNFIKWLLHRHERFSIGLLLGILLGSVIGIWPFDATSTAGDVFIGLTVAAAGFALTTALSRWA